MRYARLPLALLVALAALLGPHRMTTYAHTCTRDAVVPAPGSLLYPRGSGIGRLDLQDGVDDALPILPSSGVVGHVARSHDGARLAVSRFSRKDGETLGGSDVLITALTGGSPSQVINRTASGELLTSPSWLQDGSLIVERSTVSGGAASAMIDRIGLDGTATTVVDRGFSPNASRDGRSLAFIRTDRIDRLIHRSLETGEERILVQDPSYLALAFPRYSPDGEWLAFAAAGEPERTSHVVNPFGWLQIGPGSALAHGVPWDLWAVRVADGSLKRLTAYYDDDPAVAWSPDGQWLALFGGESIKVFTFSGDAYYCASATGGYGGLEWIE